ncbi:MAG: hypothetical protein KDB22_28640, partial [Planctomycetales bacterium]|nr:hypothetical protein [Planctomycetales bacterium]
MKRSGSVTVLFLLMLTAVIAVGAVAVDYAMMESARTDLRIASDLCSRAAVVKYIDTGSLSAARTQAKELAQVNQLFGRNVLLADADIVPGNSASQTNGKYVFTANAQPYNSFRVDARFASDSLNNSLPLLFSSVHHRQTIDLAQTSTSTETNLDVVLVLDRSGSMAFDLTGTDWS